MDPNEVFQPISTLEIAWVIQFSITYGWEEMEVDHRSGVRDRFFGRVTNIQLNEWKFHLKTWAC